MARDRRCDLVDPHEVQVFHLISRCVRRAFLCGRDDYTGNNYDHRKKWIEDLGIELLQFFALDLNSQAIMSNHMHHVVRTRPDLVEQWSNREVATRWLGICPKRKDDEGKPEQPNDEEIQEILQDPQRVEELRLRLSSISWFMARLKQQISRRCNAEEETDGAFWQARFKSTRLEDEEAVLACCVYVDLNAVRAGIAKSPLESEYCSIWHRLVARFSREKRVRKNKRVKNANEPKKFDPHADCWLSPFYTTRLPENQRYAKKGKRASDDAGLSVTLEQYVALLEWTGRQIRTDKRGSIPADVAPIFESMSLNASVWTDAVNDFSQWSRRIVGLADSMTAAATNLGKQWLHGMSVCRDLFGPDPSD